MTNWLITGGCGFIGTSLIRHLLASKPEIHIRVLDNLSVGTEDDLARACEFEKISEHDITFCSKNLKQGSVELFVGDIRDDEIAKLAAKEMDVVVHLAANTGVGPSVEDPRSDFLSNVVGVFNLLEAARCSKVKKFVFASSGAPVGNVEPPIHELLAARPVSPYGASKLAGEGYCSAYYQTFGIETIALRFGNVYGPYSNKKSSVVAKFIREIMEGKNISIYGDGTQTRDFIYVDDLVRAICLSAAKEGLGGEVFQIATSRETTVEEVAHKILSATSDVGFESVSINYSAERLGDVKRNFSDTSKAFNVLGWEPEYSLDRGIEVTVGWFKGEYVVS